MGSIQPEPRFTYQDYLNLPDDQPCELIDGAFHMAPAPRPYHQVVTGRIQRALMDFVEERDAGLVIAAPCDVCFSPHDVVQPDVFYIRRERLGIIKKNFVEGPPDLVVEVLSPRTSNKDRELKRKLYSRHRVLEYWIVNPDARTVQTLALMKGALVEVRLFNESESLTSELLEGFALPLSEVFVRMEF